MHRKGKIWLLCPASDAIGKFRILKSWGWDHEISGLTETSRETLYPAWWWILWRYVFQAACWAHPIKRGKAWWGTTTLWFFWSGGGRVFPYTQHSRTRTRPEKLVCKISPLDVSIPESWSFSSTCCAVSGRNVMSLTLQIVTPVNQQCCQFVVYLMCQHLFTLEHLSF